MDQLPDVGAFGFSGGRDSLHEFARRAFAEKAPPLLRGIEGNPAIFRNADLKSLGANPAVGAVPASVLFGLPLTRQLCDNPPAPLAIAGLIANQIFTFNPPIHGPVRKIIVRPLGPKQVRDMVAPARECVRAVLDELPGHGPVDAMSDIAEPLTCRFWGDLLAMTTAERHLMEKHVRDLTPMFFLDRTSESIERLDTAVRGYRATIEAAATRAIAGGSNPLVSGLARDLAALPLDDDLGETGMVPGDVGALLAGNLVDGFHTAALAAANALLVLAREPEVWRQIADQPALIPEAIGEALRLEPPVIFLKRWTLDDVSFAGTIIPKGTVIDFIWAMGGFDPAVFLHPFTFRFGRPRGAATTFGGGVHLCPGRSVAAMLLETLVSELLARGWAPQVEGPPLWYDRHAMSQLRALPLRFMAVRR